MPLGITWLCINGESGSRRWQEGALYHAKTLGAPAWVWNSTAVTYDADIRTRPLFANWLGAAALVSVHNNASPAANPGAGTGTEIWIDTSNGQGPASERLARAIQMRPPPSALYCARPRSMIAMNSGSFARRMLK